MISYICVCGGVGGQKSDFVGKWDFSHFQIELFCGVISKINSVLCVETSLCETNTHHKIVITRGQCT